MFKRHVSAALIFTATFGGGFLFNKAVAQPYGGCDEAWQAPHSAGARECRRHGWIVRRHLVVGPNKIVRFTDLPACPQEDSLRCWWDAERRGNREGRSFVEVGFTERHIKRIWVKGFGA